jgi:hypothetical protein
MAGTRVNGRARLVVAAGFAAVLAIRILFLTRLDANPDLEAFANTARIVERGGDVYAETQLYNYTPLWSYVLAGIDVAAKPFGIPLPRALMALLLLVDVATAWLVFSILRGRGRPSVAAAGGALLFFGNPISVIVSSRRGMFDDVAILFVVLGVLLVERRRAEGRDGLAPASAALAASLLVKHVAWFHPLLLLRRRPLGKSAAAALLPYAVFAASFLPFLRSWGAIRANVFEYRSMSESYGVIALRFLPWMPRWGGQAVLALAAVAAVVWLRRRNVDFARASLFLFLVVLVFAPGITPYYFVWPIALGALTRGPGYFLYTATISLFLIGSPDAIGLELPHLPGWWGAWWATVLWLLWEIRGITRTAAEAPSAASPSPSK